MNTEIGCTAKETKLNELMQKIIDMSSDLQDAKGRLGNLSDRLLGCFPEEVCSDAKTPESSGAIGLLEDKINILKYQVSETVNAINRMVDSGIA